MVVKTSHEYYSSSCAYHIITIFLFDSQQPFYSDSFTQMLTLVNNYLPTWDFFPDDITIDVFAEYGTSALGFPTAFQQCGASPVEVSYADLIEDRSCFAEKILTRTFKVVDICARHFTFVYLSVMGWASFEVLETWQSKVV